MRACWADNATVPIECSIDIDERYNCRWALEYKTHDECPQWNEELAIKLARDIVGDKYDFTIAGLYQFQNRELIAKQKYILELERVNNDR